MSNSPTVSIIIPLYEIKPRFFKDFKKFDNLRYKNYELLVVCDKKVKLPKLKNSKPKLILTNLERSGPAEKRDLAIKLAKGSVCAFIDDDAYPEPDWLLNAVRWFKNKEIVAVGGPGVTPAEDDYWQNLGGKIIESFFCSGGVQHRYFPTKRGFVDDYPAYNLFVRTDILKKVDGYNCNYYGGEDTFLCRKIIKYGDILYEPEVVVYHHRRSFPFGHIKQISNVGLHRGYFFKVYPDTSRKLFYLLPSILTIGLFISIALSILNPIVLMVTATLILFFYWLGAWSVIRRGGGVFISLLAGIGIILTHIAYGISFVRGVTIKNLSR